MRLDGRTDQQREISNEKFVEAKARLAPRLTTVSDFVRPASPHQHLRIAK